MHALQTPNWTEPRRYRFLTLYLPYLALGVIAMFWPAEGALFGVDFRSSWLVTEVPSISGYVQKSQFPSAMAAYFVLTGLLFLPLFVLLFVKPELAYANRSEAREAIQKFRRRRPCLMLLALTVGGVGVWISWIQPGYEYAIYPISARRGALAVAGPFFSFFTLSYSAMFIAYVGVKFSFFVTAEEV